MINNSWSSKSSYSEQIKS